MVANSYHYHSDITGIISFRRKLQYSSTVRLYFILESILQLKNNDRNEPKRHK